ncbi:MAG: CcmD family protein [Methanosarcinales archaeon]|nr:CcmD family protein [Methanosarcinales archaeon]
MNWLLSAFGIVWLVLIVYLLNMLRKRSQLIYEKSVIQNKNW